MGQKQDGKTENQ